ncbi:MAG: ComEC/Rec2 family competence protein [Actinobacteria bacterium]|nr:ComEC/Rec2 family competence protein [Actinomycetota bacterium]
MRSARISLAVLVGIAALLGLALAHTDEIRARAAAGLGRGMPAREAALARGFVLGQDEGIDAGTKDDFTRAGLSHLLAVSGENVTLLALLATTLLGALGIPLRERLLWVLALIALYVPLAGSGPSIQRAGVMGAAGLVATLAGRRASTLYALGLALLVTVVIDPAVAGDVGWQLSFSAVLGIYMLAGPIRDAALTATGGGAASAGWRRALAEGAGVTVAATLATAPLIAFYFEEASLTTLAANLLAMPAVAPAMWLGMVGAAAAQVPGLPLAPLNGLDALLLAYIAQVAAWCGRPDWAVVAVHLDGGGLAATYAALAGAIVAVARLSRWRRLRTARARRLDSRAFVPATRGRPRAGRAALLAAALAVAVALVAAGAVALRGGPGPGSEDSPYGLRVEVLDVGQGDAILLQPAAAPAVLVDGGPPGDRLEAKLAAAGVESLGAAVVSHDQADHAGGLGELLGSFPVARLLYGASSSRLIAAARAAGARPVQIARGDTVRSGSLRLEVLWPPPELAAEPPGGTDANQLALVLLVRWHRFSMLLSADAEAESVPLDPGQVDVLKVAHHGSDDAGLSELLDRTRPRLAVISVGDGNPFGHPTPGTLTTLARHRVPVLRTDLAGTVEIYVRPGFMAIRSG